MTAVSQSPIDTVIGLNRRSSLRPCRGISI